MRVEFNVLQPHGREIDRVVANGVPGVMGVIHTPPGAGFSIQTWVFDLRRPEINSVLIEFSRT